MVMKCACQTQTNIVNADTLLVQYFHWVLHRLFIIIKHNKACFDEYSFSEVKLKSDVSKKGLLIFRLFFIDLLATQLTKSFRNPCSSLVIDLLAFRIHSCINWFDEIFKKHGSQRINSRWYRTEIIERSYENTIT